jgi:hypothetical protein
MIVVRQGDFKFSHFRLYYLRSVFEDKKERRVVSLAPEIHVENYVDTIANEEKKCQ